MKKKPLFYFVDSLNASFVLNDINILSSKFDIYLFITQKIQQNPTLPETIKIFDSYLNWKKYQKYKIFICNALPIIKAYIEECAHKKEIISVRRFVSLFTANIFKAYEIQNILKKENIEYKNSVFYAFWFYDCVFLAWLRKKKVCSAAVCRAHGGDLFEERGSLTNKVLARVFQFNHLDRVFSVSEAGAKYLKKKYPAAENKIFTRYLGSRDHERNIFFDNKHFTVVSCAKIRNIKRIHLIAEVMTLMKMPLTWYHIGDENLDNTSDPTIYLYKKKKNILLNSKYVRFLPMGALTNEDVYTFYAETSVNLFISLSEAEGLPVSMMEAQSFGIPILSTEVGGCPEIVNSKTGILIPPESTPEFIAKKITEFKNSSFNDSAVHKEIKQHWNEHFNITTNYKLFCEDLFCL